MDWIVVLDHVAQAVRADIELGRRHLLTEDRVRWFLLDALQASSVMPGSVKFEYRVDGVGAVDLVVVQPPSIVVELKFPRDPRSRNPPDTMTTGELLRDLARLAVCPIDERIALQVIPDRLRGHLDRRHDVSWAWSPGDRLALTAKQLQALPKTARDALGQFQGVGFAATCIYSAKAGDLSIVGYRICEGGSHRPIADRATGHYG